MRRLLPRLYPIVPIVVLAPALGLHERLEAAFDPAGIFNSGRMYEDI